jgi:hypothetical protein
MKSSLILALLLGAASSPALAQQGADSRAHQFVLESYAMKRDGRLERLMEEGRANKAAFEALKQRELQEPTATGSVRPPRQRRS